MFSHLSNILPFTLNQEAKHEGQPCHWQTAVSEINVTFALTTALFVGDV